MTDAPYVPLEPLLASGPHEYLSTACLHGYHGYCQSQMGEKGPKVPARCKWCDARCRCVCHPHPGQVSLSPMPDTTVGNQPLPPPSPPPYYPPGVRGAESNASADPSHVGPEAADVSGRSPDTSAGIR